MQRILNILLLSSLVAWIAACGGNAAKDKKGETGDLKVKLEEKKKEKSTLDEEIRKLEEEIAKADPTAVQAQKLVSADTLKLQDFSHFIELQGQITSDNIVTVMPRGMPAQVRQLNVKRGDFVRKGQLLAKLDDAVMLQQVDGLKTQLAFAENLYNRQKNLWDQGIGTEVQLITAKNNVDNIKKQIASLNETWKTSFVYAPISGVAEVVNVRVGETFSGIVGNGMPQIQIVNSGSLKMVSQVPENYITRVRKGAAVEVAVPETGRAPFRSSISVIGSSIDPINRSFEAEAKLPTDPVLRPNQLATMRILDYTAKSAVVTSINVVQTDEKGKYVYVIEKSGDRFIVRKRVVIPGESFNGLVEIKSGLKEGDVIVSEGYQTVYDGQAVLISK